MTADWMQARIAELVAERDEAMNMLADIEIAMNCVGSEMDKVVKELDDAMRERAAEVERRLGLERIMFLNRTYPTIEYPPTDEDEMIARLETTVRGWQPGTTAGKECRGNAGDGYRTQEREDDHV